jgi:hypothetical protein
MQGQPHTARQEMKQWSPYAGPTHTAKHKKWSEGAGGRHSRCESQDSHTRALFRWLHRSKSCLPTWHGPTFQVREGELVCNLQLFNHSQGWMHAQAYAYTSICVHAQAHTRMLIHTHTHTHTHTHLKNTRYWLTLSTVISWRVALMTFGSNSIGTAIRKYKLA